MSIGPERAADAKIFGKNHWPSDEPLLRSPQAHAGDRPLETPNYFLLAPDPPERFHWTQKGREGLGPRFARQGIAIDTLRTADDIEDAVTCVIQAEFAELTPHPQTDRHRIKQIYDLQFVTDPLRGVPPEPLESRRAARNAVMRQITQRLRDLHR